MIEEDEGRNEGRTLGKKRLATEEGREVGKAIGDNHALAHGSGQ